MNWLSRLLAWFRPEPKPAPPPNPGGWRYASQVMPIEPFNATDLAALHNAERARAKVEPPLLLDTRLMALAEQRAQHAASVNLDAPHLHDGFAPDPRDVMTGENAAKGQADAASVMKCWMESEGHRDNVLDAKFWRMGCGRAVSADNTTYWYVCFAG